MEEKRINRRNGPDALVKLTESIAVFSWVLIFIIILFAWILISSVFIIAYVAKAPFFEDFLEQHPNFRLTGDLHVTLIGYAFYILILMFVVCTAGLVFNSFRHHRKTDKYNRSLMVLEILSLAGIIAHLFFL